MPSLSCVVETLSLERWSLERLRARLEPPSDDERLLAELRRPTAVNRLRKWLGRDVEEPPPRSPAELSVRLGWEFHQTARLLWNLVEQGRAELVVGHGFRPVCPLRRRRLAQAEEARQAELLREASSLHAALRERFAEVPPHRALRVGSLALARVAADDPEYLREAGRKVPGNPMERAIEAIRILASDAFDAPLWLTAVDRPGRERR